MTFHNCLTQRCTANMVTAPHHKKGSNSWNPILKVSTICNSSSLVVLQFLQSSRSAALRSPASTCKYYQHLQHLRASGSDYQHSCCLVQPSRSLQLEWITMWKLYMENSKFFFFLIIQKYQACLSRQTLSCNVNCNIREQNIKQRADLYTSRPNWTGNFSLSSTAWDKIIPSGSST